MTTLFAYLGQRGISVDLISLFPHQGYFCVPEAVRQRAEDVLQRLGISYQAEGNRAKVSIVGSAIQGLPGVVGHVMAALQEAGVEVLQSADSHSTITLLVRAAAVQTAVAALHRKFGLERA
jgi:aspartate kinase